MNAEFADIDKDTPLFVISVAAELAGMHPQTLRQYDRLGLVIPGRSAGRSRRYSPRDVETLREVQRLSQEEGINLAGVKRILALEREVADLQHKISKLQGRVVGGRVFAAGVSGDVVAVRPGDRPTRTRRTGSAMVVWRPKR